MTDRISDLNIRKLPKIWTPSAEISFYSKHNTRFVYPPFGPNTYKRVGEQIINKFGKNNFEGVGKTLLNEDLLIPTGEQVADLLYEVYAPNQDSENQKYNDEIKNILEKEGIWIFNRLDWISEGVYVTSDSEAKGYDKEFNKNNLEKNLRTAKKLQNGVRISLDENLNEKVRFAPKESYKLWPSNLDSKIIENNGFMIANFGLKGAKKLEEISVNLNISTIILGYDLNDKDINKENAVTKFLKIQLENNTLYFDSTKHSDEGYGVSFAVLKN